MKRLFVVSLILMMAAVAFGQTTNTAVQTSASFTVGKNVSSESTALTFYMDNKVTFTYRHCDKYLNHDGTVNVAACNADSSTVYSQVTKHNLTTNAGKDFIKAQISGTGVTTNCAYIAVGNSAVTPAATDTTLTGEVSTNGLSRAVGTYSSTGTGTFTLVKTFTATGAVSSLQAAAVFTAASSGTMCFEVGSLGPVTMATNDTLTVTWSGSVS